MTTQRTPISREELAKMPKGTIVYDTDCNVGIKLTFSHADNKDIFFSDQESKIYSKNDDGYIGFFRAGHAFYLPHPHEMT